MEYQHFTNFNLTDPRTGKTKNLYDDFGGIVINTNETFYERECMPQLNFITDKNDTRDGEIYIGSTYGVRTIDMTILFQEELGGGDLFELKRWLHKQYNGKKYQQIFEWDGDDEDKQIYVIPQGFNSQVYYQRKFTGQIDLKFIAHNPYWFKKNEKDIKFENLTTGTFKNIMCAGNTESYPLIKIIPITTSLIFKWNDLNVTLSSLTIGRSYWMDCEKNQFYYESNGVKVLAPNNISTTIWKDFPIIDSELKNTLTIISGAGSFYISPKSRIL